MEQATFINERDITKEMAGLIDTVSISLNNPDKYEYNKLVRSKSVIRHLMR